MTKRPWTSGPWVPGHHADATSKCQCRSIMCEGYSGSIADIPLRVEHPHIGNDAPPEDEAIANARLIAAAPDLAEALIVLLDADSKRLAHTPADMDRARVALEKAGWKPVDASTAPLPPDGKSVD